ncbi:MAG: saccharopine dehydrogenase NADP-binding domain-containing protein, partial [Myxococcota bacterium]|nr:saccharopine dehydrogenase NADP-binding domain-containing protein [Myxococcota bacterium]
MAEPGRWMLYGANGYTGRLIIEESLKRGLRPVLAGRSAEPIEALARETGLDHRVFDLGDPSTVEDALADIHTVLHAAGPFSATSAPMVDAALKTQTHYLDITGEIAVFEATFRRHQEAQESGVTLISGVGFDVVPTDCLALQLSQALPNAAHLDLAFCALGGVSRGTATTALEGLPEGNCERRDGKLVPTPVAELVMRVPFADRERDAVSIPWGDLSTAWRTTNIPNIRTFMAMPQSTIRWARRLGSFRRLMAWPLVQASLRAVVRRTVRGPDTQARAEGVSHVWGEVRDLEGNRVRGGL